MEENKKFKNLNFWPVPQPKTKKSRLLSTIRLKSTTVHLCPRSNFGASSNDPRKPPVDPKLAYELILEWLDVVVTEFVNFRGKD